MDFRSSGIGKNPASSERRAFEDAAVGDVVHLRVTNDEQRYPNVRHQPPSGISDRLEYRVSVFRRGRDDAQDFRGRGLLLDGLLICSLCSASLPPPGLARGALTPAFAGFLRFCGLRAGALIELGL